MVWLRNNIYGKHELLGPKFISRWSTGIALFLILNSYHLVSHNQDVLKCKLSNKSLCEASLCVVHSTRIRKGLWNHFGYSSDRLAKTDLDGTHKLYRKSHVTVFSREYNFIFLETFVALYHMRDSTVHWVRKHVGRFKNIKIRLIIQRFILGHAWQVPQHTSVFL